VKLGSLEVGADIVIRVENITEGQLPRRVGGAPVTRIKLALQSVQRSDTMGKALRIMRQYGVRHLPVLEDGKLVGILSDRDLRSPDIPGKWHAIPWSDSVAVDWVMSSRAHPDDELAIAQDARTLWRNFQGYTVKAATDVIAFGITGISDLQGAYAQNIRPLPQYYRAISASRFATVRGVLLSDDDRRRRSVITDLMCNFWVDLGAEGLNYFQPELDDLRVLEQEGLVTLSGSEVELTALGRVFVRNVAMVFDGYLRRAKDAPRPFSMTV
jgi:hypothetical protein